MFSPRNAKAVDRAWIPGPGVMVDDGLAVCVESVNSVTVEAPEPASMHANTRRTSAAEYSREFLDAIKEEAKGDTA